MIMAISIKINNLDKVTTQFNRFSQDVQDELKDALSISLRDIQERAQEEHNFITRTGEAERSIETQEQFGTSFKGIVGTTRQITVYLHRGTQPHSIKPKKKQVLRWGNGSEFIFARRVKHPGMRKDPFIYKALEYHRSDIISRFESAVANAVKEMG